MTVIQSIKKGKIPEFLCKIADREEISVDYLVEKILNGRVVVPYNPVHSPSKPTAIGEGLYVKINVNLGTSQDKEDLGLEIEKLELAHKLEADAVMDLSVSGDLDAIRRELISRSQLPLGTVPIYQVAIEAGKNKGNIARAQEDDFFEVLEKQAKDGVDFFTIHAGITRDTLQLLKRSTRLLGVVSRGGALLVEWMVLNKSENPFYANFDRVLEICREYDVTISLGDALRPGSIFDAGDELQYQETFVVSRLVRRAREAGVQVMVEGPGHVPLNKVEHEIKAIKEITSYAPLYVLGPLVLDSCAGYDHINSAIGAAIAGLAGADFICYLTPAEHLSLPDIEDVRQGIMASRIAAESVNFVRGKGRTLIREQEVSKARASRDWQKQMEFILDRERAIEYRSKIPPHVSDTCSMCSEYCSLKIVEQALKSEVKKSDILRA